MREFYWNYFSVTGNVDAYMLYKKGDDRDEAEPADHLEDDDIEEYS